MATPEFDDLRLDLLPRLLAFAHAAKSGMSEITALAFRSRLCDGTCKREHCSRIALGRSTCPRNTKNPIGSPNLANTVIRWLAECGISVAGTRALRVRGRKTGQPRSVVVNLLTVDGADYLVSPRGNTQWARNVRAAGVSRPGHAGAGDAPPSARSPTTTSPRFCRRYLDRWYWQVKGYVGGVTPESSNEELRAAAARIPVFALAN